jgi:uncharacterized integral membrane protein
MARRVAKMKYLKALLVLLLALVLAGFIQQNSETTIIHYFGWDSPALPLSLFIIVAFASGYLLALLVGFTGDFRSRLRLFKAEREAKRLKTELLKIKKDEPDDNYTKSLKPGTEPEKVNSQDEVHDGDETPGNEGDSEGEGEEER